jgi:nickel transport protein
MSLCCEKALFLCLLLLIPTTALAHKVSIFAYVEGNEVVVDAFYSKSSKVNAGRIIVSDEQTKEILLQAVTDENGALRFPVPAQALAAGHNLKLKLVAGEGHQNETLVAASEFSHLAPPKAPTQNRETKKPSGKISAKTTENPAPLAEKPLPSPGISQAELEQTVERAVDRAVQRELAPLRQMFQRQAEGGPGVVEIVGGIGYIVGLFGVAAFVAARRREPRDK